mmetsp:Transcript_39450/g.126749  ORF Transcript_39450/g.126749 Transcript_39450/m.126749 type:complete len:255 (-) Transcript_39450:224-988(-)
MRDEHRGLPVQQLELQPLCGAREQLAPLRAQPREGARVWPVGPRRVEARPGRARRVEPQPPRAPHVLRLHPLERMWLRVALRLRDPHSDVRHKVAAVALGDRRERPVEGRDAGAAAGGAALAVELGRQDRVLARRVVERDFFSGRDVPRRDHHAVVLGAAVDEPARRVAGVVHVVGDVDGPHRRVLLDRQLVELGQRLVLIVASLVHEVAVRAARLFGQRLDPRARAWRGLHVGPGARSLRPHHLALAQSVSGK